MAGGKINGLENQTEGGLACERRMSAACCVYIGARLSCLSLSMVKYKSSSFCNTRLPILSFLCFVKRAFMYSSVCDVQKQGAVSRNVGARCCKSTPSVVVGSVSCVSNI